MDHETAFYFAPLTPSGHLAPEADVDAAVTRGSERELFAVCETYAARRVLRHGAEETNSQHRELFANKLNDSAEVTPLQALRAHRSLVDHLMQHRLDAMRDAREAGVSFVPAPGGLYEIRYQRDEAASQCSAQVLRMQPVEGGGARLTAEPTQKGFRALRKEYVCQAL